MKTIDPPVETENQATIDRAALLDAINRSLLLIPKRHAKPIVSCVRIEFAESVAKVYSTDREHYQCIEVPASHEAKFAVTVNAGKLARVLAACRGGSVIAKLHFGDLAMRSGSDTFYMIQERDSFPSFPADTTYRSFVVDAEPFTRLLAKIAPSASRESARYAINAVLLEIKPDSLCVVATNGRMLSMDTTPMRGTLSESILIPTKAVGLLQKMQGEMRVLIGKPKSLQAKFESDDTALNVKLESGQFPPFRDVIPKPSGNAVTANRESLLAAIKAATIFSDHVNNPVDLTCDKKSITLSSRDHEAGSCCIKVDGVFQGEPIAPRYGAEYLVPLIAASTAEEITIDMSAENRPCLITDGTGYKAVCMPLNK